MNEREAQTSYQLIAFILQYPDRSAVEAIPEIKDAINELTDRDVRYQLGTFINRVQQLTYEEWIDHYIEYFDFGKITNLYVTYLKLGEQRERGLELLKLKKFYASNGYEISDKELPDYLPLMLEFCGHVSVAVSTELLGMYLGNIEEIRTQLQKAESDYVYVLDALLSVMKSNGLVKTA
ncbi:nitrate reductase molybdenum cofactor assembly chaperone [Virgibacillus dakarensis]|nr:nitrate reductase molybdenum cofactor assembly chaperone [Virgibacillus dakarensis]